MLSPAPTRASYRCQCRLLIVVLFRVGRLLAFSQIVQKVVSAVTGSPAPDPPINPLALAEPGLVEGYLAGAKLALVSQEDSTYPFDFGNDSDFAYRVRVAHRAYTHVEWCQRGMIDLAKRETGNSVPASSLKESRPIQLSQNYPPPN